MKSKQARRRLGLCIAVVTSAVLTTATAASSVPAQSSYDGHLEEANGWAIEQVNAPAAWETTRGEGVTIAVIDTGMGEHPFFDDKDVLQGYSAIPSEEDAWNDWTGHPDDPDDRRGHGAGVAAMALLAAPEATILPVRDGTGDPDVPNFGGMGEAENEAIRWAADNGADVITYAKGSCCTEADEDFYMAVQYALDRGVVFVAAAGNDPQVPVHHHFPAALPGVVTVSGTTADGGGWETSTVGPEVDVAAPADYSLVWPILQNGISETSEGDECEWCSDDDESGVPLYLEAGGTSSATGWAAGVVALIRAAHPDLDEADVVQRLIRTAQDRGADGHDEVFGHGIVDASAAITADVEPVEENPLGYPLAVRGASGAAATGEPAPGTGSTSDATGSQDASSDSQSGGSDAVPLVIVAVVSAVLAGGAWFLLQKRAAGSEAHAGGPGRPVARTGALTLAVALVAGVGTYGAVDALVETTEASDPEAGVGGAEDDGGTTPTSEAPEGTEPAGEVGQTAAEGSAAAAAAQSWQDAYTAGDLETFRSLTCADPWYRVVINLRKLEDPDFVRPGFALLSEGDEGDEGWGADDYRLLRGSDDRAWVEAGDLSIGVNPDYEMALVLEDGQWKVCDFWMTGPWWQGHPEWEARFPHDEDAAMETFRREGP